MNKVILIGRLTKDPELKYTPGTGTAVTTVTVAVDNYNSKSGEKTAEFIPVVVWGKQAENLATYMSKGSQVAISGRISIRNYDAKDGTKRYVTEVVADTFNGVTFLSKGNGNGNGNPVKGGNAPSGNMGGGYPTDDFGGFPGFNPDDDMTPVDDGDMPF